MTITEGRYYREDRVNVTVEDGKVNKVTGVG